MKRFFSGLTILLCIFLLSGCGDNKKEEKKTLSIKTLECTATEEEDGMTAVISTFMDYNTIKKEFVSGKANLDVELPDEYVEIFKEQNLCEIFNGEVEEYYEDCKSSLKDNNLKLTYSLNLDLIEKEEDDFKKNMSIEEAKKYLEEDGDAVCKIK